MHILLTNDDGIHAPGLRALADGLMAAGHRVSVCAPDRERSGASHSVGIGKPLSAVTVRFDGAVHAWAVDGTPADCASLGLYLTREDPVDLVAAGINFGMNMGGACLYSGTVGAALEAAMCGTQALAVSLCAENRDVAPDFTHAARLAARVVSWMRQHPLPLGCIYNLNVPDLPYDQIRGLVPARLAPMYLGTPTYKAVDGGYLFQSNAPIDWTVPDGDVDLAAKGYAVITKLTWDFRMQGGDGELREIGLTDADLSHAGHMEIERKYLIRYPDPSHLSSFPGAERWDITQTYLMDGPNGQTRRVRKIVCEGATRYFRTFKDRVSTLSSLEDEAEITREAYETLLLEADPSRRPILKTRHRLPHRGHIIEIDVYPFWTDRAIMEIELEREDEAADIPGFIEIIRDVSVEGAYKNSQLARRIPMEQIDS